MKIYTWDSFGMEIIKSIPFSPFPHHFRTITLNYVCTYSACNSFTFILISPYFLSPSLFQTNSLFQCHQKWWTRSIHKIVINFFLFGTIHSIGFTLVASCTYAHIAQKHTKSWNIVMLFMFTWFFCTYTCSALIKTNGKRS